MWNGIIAVLKNKATRDLIKKLVIDIGIGIAIGTITTYQKRKRN